MKDLRRAVKLPSASEPAKSQSDTYQLLLVPTMSLVDQARSLSDFERAQLGLHDIGILSINSTTWWELFELLMQNQTNPQQTESVGFAAVSKELAWQSATIQSLYVQPLWRKKGVATAVVEALMYKAFVAWGMRRLGTQAYSIAESHGIYNKLMIKEGELRSIFQWKGQPVNMVQYSILQTEYFSKYPQSTQ